MRTRWIVMGLVCAAILAGLAFVILPRLLEPEQPDYWPTQGWRESTPEEQGFDTTDKSQQEISWTIGLDGTYHHLPSGEALRGGWVDGQTFAFEKLDVDKVTIQATFEGDGIVIESSELGIQIEGTQQNP